MRRITAAILHAFKGPWLWDSERHGLADLDAFPRAVLSSCSYALEGFQFAVLEVDAVRAHLVQERG